MSSEIKTVQVKHTEDDDFIINIASLRNPQFTQLISELSCPQITPDEWVSCVTSGCDTWGQLDEEEIFSDPEDNVGVDDEEFSDYTDTDDDHGDSSGVESGVEISTFLWLYILLMFSLP